MSNNCMVYKFNEVVEILGITGRELKKIINSGKLRTVKLLGSNDSRYWRIEKYYLAEYIYYYKL